MPSPRGGRGRDLCGQEAGSGSRVMREQLGLSSPPPPPAAPTAGPAGGPLGAQVEGPAGRGAAAAGGKRVLAVSTQRGARGIPRGTGGGWAGCAWSWCVRVPVVVPCTRGVFPYTWANTGRQWAGAESEGEAGVGKGAEVKVKTPGPLELQGQPPGLCPEGPGPPRRSPRWETGEGSSLPSLTPWCLSWDLGSQARWGKRRREWARSG